MEQKEVDVCEQYEEACEARPPAAVLIGAKSRPLFLSAIPRCDPGKLAVAQRHVAIGSNLPCAA